MPAAASAGALRTSADVGPTSPSGAKSTESSKEIIARSNGAPIDFSFRELKVPTGRTGQCFTGSAIQASSSISKAYLQHQCWRTHAQRKCSLLVGATTHACTKVGPVQVQMILLAHSPCPVPAFQGSYGCAHSPCFPVPALPQPHVSCVAVACLALQTCSLRRPSQASRHTQPSRLGQSSTST